MIMCIMVVQITTTCFLRPPSTRAEVDCRDNLVQFLDTSSQHPLKTSASSNHLTILVTHVPLNKLSKSIQFSYNGRSVDIRTKILLTLRPGVVVSGHIHHEEYTQHRLEEWMVSEITVPTCSYRMGELSMGVGTAVVSKSVCMDTLTYQTLPKTFKPNCRSIIKLGFLSSLAPHTALHVMNTS